MVWEGHGGRGGEERDDLKGSLLIITSTVN